MPEQEVRTNAASGEELTEEEFSPVGTMFLTVVYIIIFATAWGLVYFTDLLARR